MDDCAKSVTIIVLGDVQDKCTASEANQLNTTYPTPADTEGEDGYDDYMDMRDNIRKMRSDIVSFNQTLNYVLLHATKAGSEAHSIIRRVMRQSNHWQCLQEATELNNFRFFAQLCNKVGRVSNYDTENYDNEEYSGEEYVSKARGQKKGKGKETVQRAKMEGHSGH
eukprot:1551436-Amphidinium_carterae.3